MTIAVLLDNTFTNDRRVLREVEALVSAGYKVVVFAVSDDNRPEKEEVDGYIIMRIFGIDIYDIKKEASLEKYFSAILSVKPEVLHCHDQSMLQLGSMMKRRNPGLFLVYDSHELFHAWPLNLSRAGDPLLLLKSWLVRKYQIAREKRNARFIDRLITVNQSLALDLKKHFRLEHETIVLRNIPEKMDYTADRSLIRKKFSIPETTRILVFIGSAVYRKTLNLEQVITEISGIPDLALVIICGERGGKKELQQWVSQRGYRNVYFHPLVKPQEIGRMLASCDVGLVPTWNKKDLSYWYALDNKLFEYMMSSLPVLATRQPEYIGIVEKYGCGICVDPDQEGAYAKGLIHLLENTGSYTEAIANARNILNWENEKENLLQMYRQIPRP